MLSAFVASMALAADGRGIRMTVAQAATLAAGILGLVVLGPRLQAMGAALASSLAYLTLLAILLVSLGAPARSITPRPKDFRRAVSRLRRDE